MWCAGCFTAADALPLYAEVFDVAGALDKFNDFASVFGANFYGLPVNEGTTTLVRREYQAPESYQFGDGAVVPFMQEVPRSWTVIQ